MMYNLGVSNTRVATCADGSPASKWLPPERTFVAIWTQNYKLNVFIASQYIQEEDGRRRCDGDRPTLHKALCFGQSDFWHWREQ